MVHCGTNWGRLDVLLLVLWKSSGGRCRSSCPRKSQVIILSRHNYWTKNDLLSYPLISGHIWHTLIHKFQIDRSALEKKCRNILVEKTIICSIFRASVFAIFFRKSSKMIKYVEKSYFLIDLKTTLIATKILVL